MRKTGASRPFTLIVLLLTALALVLLVSLYGLE